MKDTFGFISIAKILMRERILVGDNRKEYVAIKKEYLRSIISLSDKLESISKVSNTIDLDLFISDLCKIGYNMQNIISVLASQAPTEESTFNPYINTGEQLTNGMSEWKDIIEVNFNATLNGMRINTNEVTLEGITAFINSLMNIDTPDVILSTYFNLIWYLEKFNLITLADLNNKIIDHYKK